MSHENIEEFVEDLLGDDRTSFTYEEADGLGVALKCTTAKVIRELTAYGLTYEGRPKEKKVRGFTSNCHDRWQNSGCHGGSGWEQVSGFAGQEG